MPLLPAQKRLDTMGADLLLQTEGGDPYEKLSSLWYLPSAVSEKIKTNTSGVSIKSEGKDSPWQQKE